MTKFTHWCGCITDLDKDTVVLFLNKCPRCYDEHRGMHHQTYIAAVHPQQEKKHG